jgi:transposase
MVLLSAQEYAISEIALALGVISKVNGCCEVKLKKLVEQEPCQAGYNFSTWICADLVRELVKNGFEKVSCETIRAHLHTLGCRVLRPVLSIASPDPNYPQKVKQLDHYKQLAKNGEIWLYFEDEIDLNLLPGTLRCWTLRSSQRKVMTPGVNVKRYGFGAVNYVSGKTLYRIEEHKNSDGFCAFVKQFMQAVTLSSEYHGQQIVLVVDNFIIHHSQKTLKFLQQYADQLILFALPTYSPWLNLIELLWKHPRRKVTHNHLFEIITQLVQAVCSFFKMLNRTPLLTLSIIGATE